jgi:hypothetical protein
MIENKTVFVVGAGASKEIKFPVGPELTTLIGNRLRVSDDALGGAKIGDPGIRNALLCSTKTSDGQDMNAYVVAAKMMRQAMPLAPSIDSFLHIHQNNEHFITIGKLGIASSILQSEHKSPLYVDPANIYNTPNFTSMNRTWYTYLWHTLSTDVGLGAVGDIFRNVAFVVFNYDRCIEHFLFECLKTYYRLGAQDAAEIMKTLKIFHPYGQIGELPQLSNGNGVGFGQDIGAQRLLHISRQIKTFTERVEEGIELKSIRSEIAASKKIVFLGFAYHQINMDLLASGLQTNVRKVYGTRLGMSDPDSEVSEGRIRQMLVEKSENPGDRAVLDRNMLLTEVLSTQLVSKTCADLFKEYSQSIGR